MRRLTLLFALCLALDEAAAQAMPPARDWPSCPAADTALGLAPAPARLSAWYDAAAHRTTLYTPPLAARGLPVFTLSAAFPGRVAGEDFAGQLSVVYQGDLAQRVRQEPDAATLTLVVDDTLTLRLGPGQLGATQGPVRRATAPVGYALPPPVVLAVARGRTLAATLGERPLTLPRDAQRAFRALYRGGRCYGTAGTS